MESTDVQWERLRRMSYSFLIENFNEFSQSQQIKVATEMVKKDVASKIELGSTDKFREFLSDCIRRSKGV